MWWKWLRIWSTCIYFVPNFDPSKCT